MRKQWMLGVLALVGVAAFAENKPTTNQYWWPKKLDLSPLRLNNPSINPMGKKFNYAKAFKTLDLKAEIQDLDKLMTTSQPWWPADFGNYGPFFIRMSWHSAVPIAFLMVAEVQKEVCSDLLL